MRTTYLVPFFFTSVSLLLATLLLILAPHIQSAFAIGAAAAQTAPVLNKPAVSCEAGKPKVTLSFSGPYTQGYFVVFRSQIGQSQFRRMPTQESLNSYGDLKVQSGKTYQYQVKALGVRKAVRFSNIQNVFVPACGTQVLPVSTSTPPAVVKPIEIPEEPIDTLKKPKPPVATTTPPVTKPATTTPTSTGTTTGSATTTPTSTPSSTAPTKPAATTTPITTPPVTNPPLTKPATTTPTSSASSTTPKPPTGAKIFKWGAYAGWRDSDIVEFEEKAGKNFDFLATFSHWGNNHQFPSHLAKFAKEKGRTLVIFWEATDYNIASVWQPKYSYDAVLAGSWDSYIKEFAAAAKAYGGPVILIPYSEMNGNWFPWGAMVNGNTPAKGVAAYRHIRDVFGQVSNVKFGWAPNSNSVPDTPENKIELYYPGDAYVDYVGVDGFNFGTPWYTFSQVFTDPLTRLSKYNKPMYIFSMASADGPQKAAWMEDAFFTQMPKYPLLQGWIWFNENKERDWRVWSDPQSYAVFKKAIGL